jgi:uncharacterized RDD family membrane protein YckC
MKATFLDRLTAYAIDVIIVGLIISLICLPLPDQSSELSDKASELTNKYTTNEITMEVFIDEYKDILYTSQKKEMPRSVVGLVITFAYFVVFQYLNKGKTIGKLLLKLKVVDEENNEPISLARGFLRSLFILGIASSLMIVLGIKILPKDTYIMTYTFLNLCEDLFIIISMVLIIGKQGRGIHDMMARTMVIKEGRG